MKDEIHGKTNGVVFLARMRVLPLLLEKTFLFIADCLAKGQKDFFFFQKLLKKNSRNSPPPNPTVTQDEI